MCLSKRLKQGFFGNERKAYLLYFDYFYCKPTSAHFEKYILQDVLSLKRGNMDLMKWELGGRAVNHQ